MNKKDQFLHDYHYMTINDPKSLDEMPEMKIIPHALNHAKEIRVTSNLNNYLFNMKATLQHTHSPYGVIFIDCDMDLELYGYKVKIISILVEDLSLLGKEFNFEANNIIAYYVHVFNFDKDMYEIYSAKAFDDTNPIIPHSQHDKEFERIVSGYVLSLLNFIMHPNVELIKRTIPKRRKSLNFGSSDSYYVAFSGSIRKYINEFNKNISVLEKRGENPIIVRGFYRTYHSDRYVNKQGSVDYIHPFIKQISGIPSHKRVAKHPNETMYIKEQLLVDCVSQLFPDHKLRKDRTVLKPYEIDVYVPDLKLGFEYDGEQHYIYPNHIHKTRAEFEEQQERDRLKREMAEKKGIKIITIRYDETLNIDLLKEKVKGR